MDNITVLDEHAKWKRRLDCSNKDGSPRAILKNVIIALRFSMAWRGVLAFDEFHLTITARKPPPWQRQAPDFTEREWTDEDDILATEWMQTQGIYCGVNTVSQAINGIAQDNKFHPIREWLEGCEWDGVPRIERFASDYLGVEEEEDDPYVPGVTKCALISAVARVMEPGCKADYMLILQGPQGTFKSTAIMTLFGKDWYSDDLPDMGTREAAIKASTAWVFEVSELGAMLRSEVERTKAFITRREDHARDFYGRRNKKRPRQCIFIGTTNQDTYLTDETGGRRFWPIEVGRVDIEAIARDRELIWAEALDLYRQGEPWWPDDTLLNRAQEEQNSKFSSDPWEPIIENWLRSREDCSVQEILSLAIALDLKDRGQREQGRAAKVLKRLGWVRYRKKAGGRLTWRYRPGGAV